MGITEWATSNRHPDAMKAAGVSAKKASGWNLFISTRYVSIVKQLFVSKSKHTKGLKECSVLMEL